MILPPVESLRELSRVFRSIVPESARLVDQDLFAVLQLVQHLSEMRAGFESDCHEIGDPATDIDDVAPIPSAQVASLAAQILRRRTYRNTLFEEGLFGEPAWDMLLDLSLAEARGVSVSVTSLCIASGVPMTTALRWIQSMERKGYFDRLADVRDSRRVHIQLTDRARTRMNAYFRTFSEGH